MIMSKVSLYMRAEFPLNHESKLSFLENDRHITRQLPQGTTPSSSSRIVG